VLVELIRAYKSSMITAFRLGARGLPGAAVRAVQQCAETLDDTLWLADGDRADRANLAAVLAASGIVGTRDLGKYRGREAMDDEAGTLGSRVRQLRGWHQLSLRQAAGLGGLPSLGVGPDRAW
jgi:hypothetical protein